MKKSTRMVISICTLALLITLFLIGTQAYFHKNEINLASDRCQESGGIPEVESDLLSLHYTFSCDKS
ncbi:hypothetical protein [Gracilibacillus salinarum]|uniref:Uncharacterized protein n=1 Tax=Gracilibacillus salinarum TaxID=2932255 RepID=A0ABY4GSE8_9BACI|nr:hypothetical protein [Gracilibacillus salinarum]UOQ87199.1 hypothetical protein MUN87_10080 [Gracilibacillus salinarum]